ncbi:MAG: SDR family NAD(P)-dependent oxidoreductase [Mahellales bacterium]
MAFEISLKGKTAMVTGGSRGIGAEICRQLAIAGANVIINYNRSTGAAQRLEKELLKYGVDVLTYKADVSKEEEVKAMIDMAVSKFGSIDILVNNAAILIPEKFEVIKYENWKKMMDIVLNGTFLVTRYVIPHMLKKEYGSIIMVTTNATINGGGSAHYAAAKAGMEGMAKQLVIEYASKGIRVNIVQPAVIDTDMLRERYPTDEEIKNYGKSLPMGRVGKPVDIANAVVFLASEKASFICGASLPVDGARTYYWRPKK